jgi:hypothetical protein
MCGKTHDLLLMSEAMQVPIIVAGRQDMERLIETAKRFGIHVPCPISTYDVQRRAHVEGVEPGVMIDDVDRVLWQMLGTRVLAATCTEDAKAWSDTWGRATPEGSQ